MKVILLHFFLIVSTRVIAQQLPDFGLDKVRITQPDKTVVATLGVVSSGIHTKPNLFYYWYSAGEIHITQGGFSGKVLNGSYVEYYPDKTLKEQGNFRLGLKSGIWKTWSLAGLLLRETKWQKGIEMPLAQPPIWKRFHLFNKKSMGNDTLKQVSSNKKSENLK